MVTVILITCIWYVIGVSGFVFWWTTEFDLEASYIFIALILGTLGVATWIIGWLVHSDHTNTQKPQVLIKRRIKK